jgi:hypothetical protein
MTGTRVQKGSAGVCHTHTHTLGIVSALTAPHINMHTQITLSSQLCHVHTHTLMHKHREDTHTRGNRQYNYYMYVLCTQTHTHLNHPLSPVCKEVISIKSRVRVCKA